MMSRGPTEKLRRYLARAVACAALGSTLSSCRIIDFDSCLYELRTVDVTGSLSENGNELLNAHLNVGEQRDYEPDKSMSWGLRGASLKGHVTSAVFRDAADPAKTLYVFPLSNPSPDFISSGYVTQNEGASLSGFFGVLAAERGVVDLRTDLPGRDSIRVVLKKNFQQDWYRPKCG
jgi:hypothetical protein